ncbi:hypothetical protein RDABS01_018655, partial [Bienertia sinuspersici]
DLNAHLISYSDHHIAVEVRGDNGEPLWAVPGVYGWPDNAQKHLTWDLLKSLCNTIHVPLVLFGDFNEIIWDVEKERGVARGEGKMEAFRDTVDICGLRDLGYKGIHHLPIYKSDHAPILLVAERGHNNRRKEKRFNFEALWLSNEGCKNTVKEAWLSGVGSSISEKLNSCSVHLSKWAENTFGDIKKRIKHKEKELKEWKNYAPDAPTIERCRVIVRELDELHRLEESYWHAPARANELRDGDKSTSYFHHKASQRRKKNEIKKMEDENDVIKKSREEIGDIINAYFTNMFTSSHPTGMEEATAGLSSMVTERLEWRVGNGTSINVRDDAWLPGDTQLRVPTPNMESPADLRVADLLDAERGEWCEEKIELHLSNEDANLVRQIPLSSRLPADVRYWWPTSDGVYTTKSGYWMGRIGHLRDWVTMFGGEAGDLWKRVWSLGGPPKLSHFVWRAYVGALATRERLFKRHIIQDRWCGQCNNAPETIPYAIFWCPMVQKVWDHVPFKTELLEAPQESFMSILQWMVQKVSREGVLMFTTIAWAAWTYRNSVVFDNAWRNMEEGAAGFVRMVEDVCPPRAPAQVPTRGEWRAPPTGVVRINTDAEVREGRGVGLGVALRNERGQLLGVGVRRIGGTFRPELAEAWAASFGVEVARRLKYARVELECDAINVVKDVISRKVGKGTGDLLIEDIIHLSESFTSFEMFHIRRNGNIVAHLAARLEPVNGVEQIFVNSFPQGIQTLAELDTIYIY